MASKRWNSLSIDLTGILKFSIISLFNKYNEDSRVNHYTKSLYFIFPTLGFRQDFEHFRPFARSYPCSIDPCSTVCNPCSRCLVRSWATARCTVYFYVGCAPLDPPGSAQARADLSPIHLLELHQWEIFW